VLEIKRNIIRILRKKDYEFIYGMCVPNFIEDVRIARCHIGNNYVGLVYLIKNTFKDSFGVLLLIDTFRVGADLFRSYLNAKRVYIVECSIKRH